MKRRDFIYKAVTCAAVASTMGLMQPAKAGAEKTIKWKMATSWPPKFPILQDSCDRLAKNIEIMSNGRLKIEVYAGGELVGPWRCSMQSVRVGRSNAVPPPLTTMQENPRKPNFTLITLLVCLIEENSLGFMPEEVWIYFGNTTKNLICIPSSCFQLEPRWADGFEKRSTAFRI